ncbi:hypothetical protein L0F63_003264, partial [Massospora cicadina]
IGTGFGLYKTTMSIGSVLQDIIAGALQDDKRGPQHSYELTMIFLVFVASCSLLVALSILVVDRFSWRSAISSNDKERQAIYSASEVTEPFPVSDLRHSERDLSFFHPLLGDLKHRSLLWYNILPPATLCLALVFSWYLFVIYFL